MIVLGFDTATAATAVGLMLDGGRVLERRDDPPREGRPGHSTHLLRLARELLEEAGMGWEQIRRVAVGVGPGTFTGLRVGVSSARALAQSLEAELVGVSSARALAHGAKEERNVLTAIDARRGEVFVAAYSAGEELVASRALPPQRVGDVLEDLALLAGRAPCSREKWIALGDGAVRFADALSVLGVRMAPLGSPLHAISARSVCELGVRAAASDRVAVLPAYGRAPDAELTLHGGAA